jgi:hypothetical protein
MILLCSSRAIQLGTVFNGAFFISGGAPSISAACYGGDFKKELKRIEKKDEIVQESS